MFDVSIYTKTTIIGPACRPGGYAAIVEYKTSAGTHTRTVQGWEESTTYYRSVLLAAVNALYLLNKTCNVTLYTDCAFVCNMVERNLPEEWRRQEWKKPSGEEIKNRELWQEFLDLKEKHKITVVYRKDYRYREKLMEILGGLKHV